MIAPKPVRVTVVLFILTCLRLFMHRKKVTRMYFFSLKPFAGWFAGKNRVFSGEILPFLLKTVTYPQLSTTAATVRLPDAHKKSDPALTQSHFFSSLSVFSSTSERTHILLCCTPRQFPAAYCSGKRVPTGARRFRRNGIQTAPFSRSVSLP